MVVTERIDIARIRTWLEEVPDPEIPVLSVMDLGIVRDIRWGLDDDAPILHVTVTPTYSGCPATEVIASNIMCHLETKGLNRVNLHTRIAPPWSTEWISESGRRKLAEYGIAPPRPPGRHPSCPRCGTTDTECLSRFGSTPCKAIYRCRACLEPFEYFKCH